LTRDFLGVLTIGFALFALVALVSFSPLDPSFNKFSTQAEGVRNMGGLVGAYLSDVLVQTLGTGSFVFPLVAFMVGWSLVRGNEFHRWPVILGFGAVFITGLCALLGVQFEKDLFFGAGAESGGVIGSRIAMWMVQWLSFVGALMFVVTIMFVSLMAMFGMSTNRLIELGISGLGALGRGLLRAGHFLLGTLVKALVELREWKKEIVHIIQTSRKEKKKSPKRSEPVIVSNELLTPVPKKMDFPDEPVEKKEEKSDFAVQNDFPFMNDSEDYQVPPMDLLNDPVQTRNLEKMKSELMTNSTILERKLADFGIEGRVLQVLPGPVITLYEFEPAPGIKVSRILSLTDDLALAMRAPSVRILAPVPGKSVVGIELPNPKREVVYFKEVMNSDAFGETRSKLALVVGKDNIGQPVAQDLAQVPHLLMAGSTGSGKSVGINAMIVSLLMNATPDEVKMIMIDPKMLELSMYDGIPHLIAPVVTNPKKAAAALQWAVSEMERRYKLMSEKGVRNITGYNNWVIKFQEEQERQAKKKPKNFKAKQKPVDSDLDSDSVGEGEEEESVPENPVKLPYVVIIIDELADLMMVASKGVEDSLMRLAQMARAAGIHLIVATQRPSVDVLTGIIKANFPARISYQVTSRVDSRTILDSMGAEKLLGKGDMLFLPPGTSRLQRIHGAMVSDEEINRIIKFIKDQHKEPEYREDVFQDVADQEEKQNEEEEHDEKYDEALALVAREQQASISMLQRKLRVGYNRAARMIEMMEREGVVGRSDGIKPRDVYVKPISIE